MPRESCCQELEEGAADEKQPRAEEEEGEEATLKPELTEEEGSDANESVRAQSFAWALQPCEESDTRDEWHREASACDAEGDIFGL